MPDRDLRLAIRWKFRDLVEGPLEGIQVGFVEAEPAKDGEGRRTLLAFSVASEAISDRLSLAKTLQIKLTALEPDASALAAAHRYLYGAQKERHAILSLDYHASTFLVVEGGRPIFAQSIPALELNSLMQSLYQQEWPGIGHLRALELLGRGNDGEKPEAGERIRSFYSHCLVEIQRVIDMFVAQYQPQDEQRAVDCLYICGPGAVLPEFAGVMSKNLGIDAKVMDPFIKLQDSFGKPIEVEHGAIYAAAVGLALPMK